MYREVFNGSKMVLRKIKKKQKGGAISVVTQEAPVTHRPAVIEDKKVLRTRLAGEIFKML